jgi:hypothetical protein
LVEREALSASSAHDRGPAGWPDRLRLFAARHWVFALVLLAAAAVRVVIMLGYPGPLLYPDSALYVRAAKPLQPALVNPSGYAIMLRLLDFLHTLTAVIVVQHLMGLAIGVLGYALLRRRFGLPGWAATLAMIPVLLSAYAMQLEHFLLSDTTFAFLVMTAVVIVMWRAAPPWWACALAGLVFGLAATVRVQGIPLLVVFLAGLLIGFSGRRTLAGTAVCIVAFAVPVVEYANWFNSVNGTHNLTTSTGGLLYGEVSTFANCTVIDPPASERKLCVDVPVSERKHYAPYYSFRPGVSPLRKLPGGWAGSRADSLGLAFALRAIAAQPLDYLRAAGENFAETFALHSGHPRPYTVAWAGAREADYKFPAAHPNYPMPLAASIFRRLDGVFPAQQVVRPWSGWMQTYQRYVVLSGPLLGLIVLAGLAGLILSWRRLGGPGMLPWLTGITLLAAPAAILFDPRFVVAAVAPLCVAAAIGIQQIAGRVVAASTGRDEPEAIAVDAG